jgi:hypothetical protein
MSQGSSKALKARVVTCEEDEEDDSSHDEDFPKVKPDEYEGVLHDYMALAHQTFTRNPARAKAYLQERSSSKYVKNGTPRLRSCFNCSSNHHFIAECPYEPREKNEGRLVRKDKSKVPYKKPFFNKKFPNKKSTPRIVLVAHEEYSSDDDDEEEEETSSQVAAIAIASPSSSSLFESPNENSSTRNAKCFMAKLSEVSPSLSTKTPNVNNDNASLSEVDDSTPLTCFMANLKGETKMHFEGLLEKYLEANLLLEKKEENERDYADEIATLNVALEEEHELRLSLEKKIESHEISQSEVTSKLTKERDHFRAKYKLAKKKKVEFGVGHEKLTKDLEEVEELNKALEDELSNLTELHEQLQIQLKKVKLPSTSTPTCEHANVIEENARLKKELARIKGKGPMVGPSSTQRPIVGPLILQRPHNSKEGLGYVAPKKSKNKKKIKKAKPAHANETPTSSNGVTRDTPPRSDFAGTNNPHHILYVDYYGDVYAQYVGPSVDYIAYSIWVPKTLVTNLRGPIERWGPKPKQ